MKMQVCILLVGCLVTAFTYAGKTAVKVTNPLDEPRSNETVSIDFKSCYPNADASRLKGQKPAVYSETLKKYIVCQSIDNNSDGINDELIFQADFAGGQSQVFTISEADEVSALTPQNVSIAMYVPQRKDDFAWENDRIAFRVYGQELQRTELTSSGIDVWVKSVPYPVMEKMYAKGHDYYHSDNGESLDFYTVGTTLGCGGLGVWYDNKLFMPENYVDWKIIANGPIRSIFELTYKPWSFGNKTIGETKRITLDTGSNFNRIESRFEADVNDVLLAVGIVKCERGGRPTVAADKSRLSYWQNPDAKFGTIGCGVIVPKKETDYQSVEEKNHYLILVKPDNHLRSITYYAGAGWSRSEQFDSEKKWTDFVEKVAKRIENPLKVEMLKD